MEHQLNSVRAFQEAFKVELPLNPTLLSEDRAKLRQSLLQEEVFELHMAQQKGDIVEVADAIIDIMYITLGTALEYGMGGILPKLFDEVHASNMTKFDEDGNPIFRADGKIMKPEGYRPPNLEPILKRDFAAYKEMEAVAAELEKEHWEVFNKKVDEATMKRLNPVDKKKYKQYLKLQEELNSVINVSLSVKDVRHHAVLTVYDEQTEVWE